MKKHTLSLIAALMALMLILTACANHNDDNDERTVYAAGIDEYARPAIWKNGLPFVTMDSAGFFNSVYVSGGILYAAGQADGRPFYWRSDDPNRYNYLGNGDGWAASVHVSGGYMYVAGWDSYGGKIWRSAASGSAAAVLYDFGADAWPYSICVYGSSVYAGGFDAYGSCVWENNQIIAGIDDDSAYIYSIDVSNGVVYAAGEVDERPVWFKTTGSDYSYYLGDDYGLATSVRVSGNYMYIAEYGDAAGRVWRGAASSNITSIRYSLGSQAAPESVFVSGNDVYTGGWDAGGGRIWRNGSPLYSLGYDTDVFSIFIN